MDKKKDKKMKFEDCEKVIAVGDTVYVKNVNRADLTEHVVKSIGSKIVHLDKGASFRLNGEYNDDECGYYKIWSSKEAYADEIRRHNSFRELCKRFNELKYDSLDQSKIDFLTEWLSKNVRSQI